jgi:hypothetical protein
MPISRVLAEPLAEGVPLGPSELLQLLGDYREYLIKERGLANQTVAGYLSVARQFLSHVARADGLQLSNLTAKSVLRAAQHRCVGSTKHLVRVCDVVGCCARAARQTADSVGRPPRVRQLEQALPST